jgi:uncharacterized protein YkwD
MITSTHPFRPRGRNEPHLHRLAAAVAALATVALLLGQPQAAAATTTEAAARTVFGMINAERAANRLPALASSAALTVSAHAHNLAMAAAGVMSHQLPGEAGLGTRISRVGIRWHAIAENIGYNGAHSIAGAQVLAALMYGERAPNDGHRRNVLSNAVRYVGIDTYIDATGRLWLTEDFADTAAAPPARARTAATVKDNPFGYLDHAFAQPGHRAMLLGWALDPDLRAEPLQIAVYADGRGIGWFNAPVPRPDVARAMHAGPSQGFRVTVTLPPGRHSVCAYAINIGRGTVNPRIGCATVIT